jgi:hypothetical protein
MGSDVTSIKSLFSEKVDMKEIQRIETKLAECAPWEAVRGVYKELYLYLRKDDFDLYRTEQTLRHKEF